MKKQHFLIIGIVLAITIVIGITSTGYLTLNQNNQEEIKIGIMFPLSGDLSAIGDEIVNSLSIALEEINQEGINGKKIKLIYQDSKCDGKEAINAMNKLINVQLLQQPQLQKIIK